MKRSPVLLAGVLVVLGSCSYFSGRTEPYRPPAVAATPVSESGRELYLRDCAWCHGSIGEGTDRAPDMTSGTNGPALVDFVLSTGRMPLVDPEQRMRAGVSQYSPAQIEAIVEFVSTFEPEGPDIPEVDLAAAHLQQGGVLYQENCAACHSTTGVGGALTQGRQAAGRDVTNSSLVAPDLDDSTPIEIAEAVRTGPGTMPVFGSDTFSDSDVNNIARYVAYLQDPVDRGGADIGRIGPVAEGAVGWIVGLGVLIVFIRWIGTKRGDEA